jgi:NhaP-type Na+/H+ and K+/H+ antiporter
VGYTVESGTGRPACISWVDVLGAAPTVLVTFRLIAGVSGSGLTFQAVFFAASDSAIAAAPSWTLTSL